MVFPCIVAEEGLKIAHKPYAGVEADRLARADGFPNFAAMKAWFGDRYGLPFKGEIISWKGDHA